MKRIGSNAPHTARTHCLWLALTFIFALGAPLAIGQTPAGSQISYEGTLGQARIGLTLVVTDGGSITGGHYFYAKYLTDIPLTGSTQPGSVSLKGEDGGAFALKFVGNGSEGGKPLDFNNSVGLEGSWSKDGKSLQVKLTGAGMATVPASGRWYEQVTEESDSAFEAKVRGFRQAVLAGDKAAAARYVDFPLRVNQNGKSHMVRNTAELAAQWDKIFTPGYLEILKKDIPHDLSVSRGQAMLGSGDVWFTSKGASALNLP
jgi:hypothetical protein